MANEHPNISIVKKFDATDVASSANILADDAVFHFFNPRLPDIQGDYVGVEGIQSFFKIIGERTYGTFQVNPISITAVGDELVVAQTKNTMILGDKDIKTDVVAVWRVVDGQITEIWDIPSVYT